MKARSRALLLPVLVLCAVFGYAPNSVGQGGGVQTLVYVPPAGRVGGLDGFVRVVNRSTTPATVEITGFDDTGARYGPVTLAMSASSSVRLLSEHLERGSATDGLPVGLGDGAGDWRLEFRSASHVEAVALVRTPDKFMTSLQAVVEPEAEGGAVYPVAVFNPGSNTAKASVLRLVNPGDASAAVTITGIDDRGESGPGGDVRLTVPARGAVRVTAAAFALMLAALLPANAGGEVSGETETPGAVGEAGPAAQPPDTVYPPESLIGRLIMDDAVEAPSDTLTPPESPFGRMEELPFERIGVASAPSDTLPALGDCVRMFGDVEAEVDYGALLWQIDSRVYEYRGCYFTPDGFATPWGRGILTIPSRRGFYSGMFYAGAFYEGAVDEDGDPVGQGVLTWPDGRRYEGELSGGVWAGPNGRGQGNRI